MQQAFDRLLRTAWAILAAFVANVALAAPPAEEVAPTLPAMPEIEIAAGLPLPAWLSAEMEIRAAGSGRWIADNRAHLSPGEPFDQYGVEWSWAIGRTSLTGRLFGLRGGAEQATFWEFRLAWDPYRGKATLQQWGLGGTYGEGELCSTGEGATELVQIFRRPGAPAWVSLHLTTLTATEERGESYDLEAGAWKRGRTYVWKPAP